MPDVVRPSLKDARAGHHVQAVGGNVLEERNIMGNCLTEMREGWQGEEIEGLTASGLASPGPSMPR